MLSVTADCVLKPMNLFTEYLPPEEQKDSGEVDKVSESPKKAKDSGKINKVLESPEKPEQSGKMDKVSESPWSKYFICIAVLFLVLAVIINLPISR